MSRVLLDERVDLLGMPEEELTQFMQSLGMPAYRARQIMRWVYKLFETDVTAMTDLPEKLREELTKIAHVSRPIVEQVQQSADGTRKFLFSLPDGMTIESVLIRDEKRLTACVSSQVGCGIGCSFCATGLGGLQRNLRSSEIIGQLIAMQGLVDQRITNVVMMGMGEPLANYKAVMTAIRLMTHPLGLGIGQRHITISTSGIVPGIDKLADEGLQVGLAVSLHAPTNPLRDELVPLNKKYPIEVLMQACQNYIEKTGRRITMEYVLIRDVNDSEGMADKLARLLRPLLCHLNVIPLNPVHETGLERPDDQQIARFADVVTRLGVPVTVRKEMGTDIDAACGQLRRQKETASL